MTKKEMLKNSLYGFVIADALGSSREFSKDGFLPDVEEMEYNKWFEQPKGTFTDDTSLTLATFDALSKGKNLDFVSIMEHYVTYLDGNYTIDNELFDIGLGTEQAFKLYQFNKKDPITCGSIYEGNNGNGAMMRILPVAFIPEYDTDIQTRFGIAKNFTTLTHGHQYSIVGSFMYLETIKLLLENQYEDFNDVLTDLKNVIEPFIESLNSEDYTIAYNQYKDIFDRDFINYGVRGSGYVVDTFRFAIQTLLKHDNYMDSARRTANYGGDNDTVGAIMGSMARLFYKNSKNEIKESWLSDLRGKDMIDKYLNNFISSNNM